MSLQKLFIEAVESFRTRGITFAVAGGFAANLYRSDLRVTQDVNFILIAPKNELQQAKAIVKDLGLKIGIVREADLAGGPLFAIKAKNTTPCIIGGRPAKNPNAPGVDLLLSSLSWVETAIERASLHLVDFGFGNLPTQTLEDVILAKVWALRALPIPAKDLDDLQSIFSADHEIDWAYLSGQMNALALTIPKDAKPFLPDRILQVARDVKPNSL